MRFDASELFSGSVRQNNKPKKRITVAINQIGTDFVFDLFSACVDFFSPPFKAVSRFSLLNTKLCRLDKSVELAQSHRNRFKFNG